MNQKSNLTESLSSLLPFFFLKILPREIFEQIYKNLTMSNSTRCAACKSLRRRCPPDCVLAPYFPSTNPERFSCVHKVFGASNITRMLLVRNTSDSLCIYDFHLLYISMSIRSSSLIKLEFSLCIVIEVFLALNIL